jgi:hypothetical protein
MKLKAKKPLKISNREMNYDFSKNLIQDIENENHIQILLNTKKFTIEK